MVEYFRFLASRSARVLIRSQLKNDIAVKPFDYSIHSITHIIIHGGDKCPQRR